MKRTHDKRGRAYARLSALRAGDLISFEDGTLLDVYADEAGRLYVMYQNGLRYLNEQDRIYFEGRAR